MDGQGQELARRSLDASPCPYQVLVQGELLL